MNNDLRVERQIQKIQRSKRSLMRRLGNNTLNLFQVRNFDSQGFINDGVEKWKPVLSKKPGQKIGIRTGRMRRSGKSTVTRASRVQVSFDAPYSSHFNKKRRLVGRSMTANRENKSIIIKHYNSLLK